jgi:predicted nuclease of predicted toxin-antitoxin system
MRFLADMGVAHRIVEWLRAEGHDALHLREEGLQRMPDGDIFEKAVSEKRIILTFDLDFGEIVALSAGRRASVILFRLHNTRTPHVMDRLRKVLKDSGEALEKGAIVVVEESRHRTRRLARGA